MNNKDKKRNKNSKRRNFKEEVVYVEDFEDMDDEWYLEREKKKNKRPSNATNLKKRPNSGIASLGFGKKTLKSRDKAPKFTKEKSNFPMEMLLERKDICPVAKKCGCCSFINLTNEEQLKFKQKQLEKLLSPFGKVHMIKGMKEPYHYRNKVHAVFDRDAKGRIISGTYKKGSHDVVAVKNCLIEDKVSSLIIKDIKDMLKSFKIKTYDEDTGYGLLRHVLVRRGFATGEVMVVLVLADPIMPSKNNFVKALLKKHPEITTIVLNVNGDRTSMILGEKEHTLYGKGYIEDVLCGMRFKISPKSFYQVNSVQAEMLYKKAIDLACIEGEETVIDAYCGTGTIGIIAAPFAKRVIGVELNRDAYKDAIKNAKVNGIKNIDFYNEDAGEFMLQVAASKDRVDVVIMDPPRSGSSELFIEQLSVLSPKRVVYISCNPETLARDLKLLKKKGYKAREFWPYDMFPFTEHVETAVLLSKVNPLEKKIADE
nr:23S rRNA (uracil(1939)-C(5))-methyltransferase RlmD [Acetitomaculum ruminis]